MYWRIHIDDHFMQLKNKNNFRNHITKFQHTSYLAEKENQFFINICKS